MPSGLAEADAIQKGLSEKKKPEFIRQSTNSIEPINSVKSQSALMELPHKAILRSNAGVEDKQSISRSLMEKAHELHAKSKAASNSESKAK